MPYGPKSLYWLSRRNEDTIHVGMILKNVAIASKKASIFKMQFITLIRSILKLHKDPRPLHFLVLTDTESAEILNHILRLYVEKFATVRVTYEFFDTGVIGERFWATISELKLYFTSTSEQARKYRDDLFMLAPFYHKVFPFKKLIFLDVDLRFRIDIAELHDLFDKFEDDNVMGVASDLSPHYRHALREYRSRHPGTHIGEPGRFQGLNTGVVLFDLDKMRMSNRFNKYTSNEGDVVTALADKYLYRSHLGDQCFFTLLSLEFPELFYHLHCSYNYQLDTTLYREPFYQVFLDYHNCTNEVPRIYHGNGGVIIPSETEDTPMPSSSVQNSFRSSYYCLFLSISLSVTVNKQF